MHHSDAFVKPDIFSKRFVNPQNVADLRLSFGSQLFTLYVDSLKPPARAPTFR